MINRARTFVFSTALPPYIAAHIQASVCIVSKADAQREYLAGLCDALRARLRQAGFDLGRSNSQIVPLLLGPNEVALQFAHELADAGFAARAIRPPTVPAGTARLRLSLNAGFSADVVDKLVEALIAIRNQHARSFIEHEK